MTYSEAVAWVRLDLNELPEGFDREAAAEKVLEASAFLSKHHKENQPGSVRTI